MNEDQEPSGAPPKLPPDLPPEWRNAIEGINAGYRDVLAFMKAVAREHAARPWSTHWTAEEYREQEPK